ncbi:MAG: SusC/RagA family TonB-linked outer membrane protein [Prevotella sp.]|nr:SusC/RagA family TonB-linked outer membrane protein [Prevotella sp.]
MSKVSTRERRFLLLVMLSLWILAPWGGHALAQSKQNDRVTLNLENVTVDQLFSQIKKQTGYNFIISGELAKSLPKVSAHMNDKPVREVLNQVLDHAGCTYDISGRTITVFRKLSENRDRTVTGYVRDESGEPLIGVPICIGESRVCTVTDENGYFALKVPTEPCYLKFSYVGMKTLMEPIPAGRSTLQRNIVMTNDTQLDEVVVTGIFRKARESYTGSVSTIDKEQLEQFRGQNLLQTLKNVDASLHFSVNNIAGSDPNNLPNINIRGNASLPTDINQLSASEATNPNTPLIIMDGFEISLTKLMDYNDEEIESINILKDAAATAIYGSRGANGVIVVVSRQPEPGELKVNVEAGIQMEIPDLSSYHLLNAAQKLELERLAGLYDYNWTTSSSSSNADILYKQAYNKRLKDVLSGIDTDWLAKPLRLGVGQRYNLRLEGGSKEFRWSADAQYNDVAGAMKGSDRRTFNGSITLLYRYKNLLFRNYTSVGINNSKQSPYGSFSTYVSLQPYNSPYDENGNIRKTFDPFYSLSASAENPLYNATLGSFDKSNYQSLTNNFSIDWTILPELTLRGQMGISNTVNESDFFRSPDDTYYTNTTSSTAAQYLSGTGFLRRGLYRYGQSKSTALNTDLTLSYNKIFNDVHSLYAGLNWSLRQSSANSFNIALEGYSGDDSARIANARQYAENATPSGSNTKVHAFGVTGNINYTFDNKYYIDLSYRVDGNSTYGSNKKYSSFWSSGIGWNVHRENFLKNNKVVNMLRLKASYGQTGSASGASETDSYTYYNYITDNRYMTWMGTQLGGFGNPDLTWQLTKQFNVGTEFGLFDNRIRGSFDVYTKNTDDLLSSMTIPLSMGFSSYKANIGAVKNRGWEASLQVFPIRNQAKRFTWMVGGQIVHNVNKIAHLSQEIKDQMNSYMRNNTNSEAGIQSLLFEGDPTNAIYAVRSLGIDPSTGKEIYLDKDGKITDIWNSNAKVFLGSSEPTYNGNLNSMVQWKNLTLNVSFSYYWGGVRYNSTLRDRVEVTTNQILNSNVDERVLSQRWFQPGDVVFFKRLSNESTYATSRYVMDDNVLELQSVSLQYKLSNDWLKKHFKLQMATFAINANSLFYWGSIKQERGTSYPFARNVQASLRLMF